MSNLPLLKLLTTFTMEISACHNVSPSRNVDENEKMEDFVNAQPLQCHPPPTSTSECSNKLDTQFS